MKDHHRPEPSQLKDHHRMRAWDGESYWYLKGDGIFHHENAVRNLVAHSVIPKMEIELCAGLKDKNGKLIFEGDIVLNGGRNWRVIIAYGQAQIHRETLEDGECVESCTSRLSIEHVACKIIGNIHQNPELLNKP